jgi:hypothetical protein
MAKITLSDLVSIQNDLSSVTAVNDNNDTLETAIENTLSRDGTSPNSMGASLDMNGNRILNLPAPTSNLEPMRLVDFTSAAVVHGTSVVTPGTTTSQAIVRWGDTGGTTLSNSGATIDNSNNISCANISASLITTTGITDLGNLSVTGTSSHTGNATFGGTLGVTGVTNLTTDLNVNTNKFQVTGASGNTAIAGTLAVTGVATFTVSPVFSAPITAATITTLTPTTIAGNVSFSGTPTFGAASFSSALTSTSSITSSSATAGIGYSVGSGGTITQITSKSTGVTLNTICGVITMNNAALAATTSVSFTLTNSAIGTTDIVLLQILGVGTAASYFAQVDQVLSGSCRIHFRNITAGSLSEAVQLSFIVFKGAQA